MASRLAAAQLGVGDVRLNWKKAGTGHTLSSAGAQRTLSFLKNDASLSATGRTRDVFHDGRFTSDRMTQPKRRWKRSHSSSAG